MHKSPPASPSIEVADCQYRIVLPDGLVDDDWEDCGQLMDWRYCEYDERVSEMAEPGAGLWLTGDDRKRDHALTMLVHLNQDNQPVAPAPERFGTEV